MKIDKQVFDELFSKKEVKLKGFSCCSFEKKTALRFAFPDMKENEISVILCIIIDKDGDYFILDSKEYSNFPEEKEVLI